MNIEGTSRYGHKNKTKNETPSLRVNKAWMQNCSRKWEEKTIILRMTNQPDILSICYSQREVQDEQYGSWAHDRTQIIEVWRGLVMVDKGMELTWSPLSWVSSHIFKRIYTPICMCLTASPCELTLVNSRSLFLKSHRSKSKLLNYLREADKWPVLSSVLKVRTDYTTKFD